MLQCSATVLLVLEGSGDQRCHLKSRRDSAPDIQPGWKLHPPLWHGQRSWATLLETDLRSACFSLATQSVWPTRHVKVAFPHPSQKGVKQGKASKRGSRQSMDQKDNSQGMPLRGFLITKSLEETATKLLLSERFYVLGKCSSFWFHRHQILEKGCFGSIGISLLRTCNRFGPFAEIWVDWDQNPWKMQLWVPWDLDFWKRPQFSVRQKLPKYIKSIAVLGGKLVDQK